MQIFDVTVTLQAGMPIYPGNPPFELERVKRIEEGASSNVSKITLGVHTGTHVDAPVHFLPGTAGVELLSLETLNGRALVIALDMAEGNVTAEHLQNANIPPNTARLIIRTRNSNFWRDGENEFRADFAGVTADAAQWIVGRGLALVGVDYLSVGPKGAGRPTHEILLGAGVVVVEGLDLSSVEAGQYDFHCLPLKLRHADGAPARAILVKV